MTSFTEEGLLLSDGMRKTPGKFAAAKKETESVEWEGCVGTAQELLPEQEKGLQEETGKARS